MAIKKMLGIRVSPEVLKDIDAVAKAMDRSRAWVSEEAVKQYCQVQKWQLKEIAASFSESERGGPAIQNEEMEAWLKSWGKPGEKSAPKA
ncbi:MAG: CopG family ribbon-helix-helix protein [Elusimicrobiota bacterium]